MNTREFVFQLLLRQNKSGAYSNLLLDSELKKYSPDANDASFATALFYGVIEQQITIDYQLQLYLTKPLKKLRPEVLVSLRLGTYQLLWMDKVPDRAAIFESVQLVKKHHCAFAAGLVNAVLRKVASQGCVYPKQSDENYLSVRYSVPQFLISLWLEQYGEENTRGIIASLSQKPQTVIRVNTLKTTTKKLLEYLENEGVTAGVNPLAENSLVLEKSGNLRSLSAFQEGLFHVEDTAAQIAALLLDAKPGERVLDVCAAPGGKTFTIAEQMGKGEILACDIYEQRVRLIEEGAERLGIDFIHAAVQDATQFNEKFGMFDRVLCDVPCSGLGIIRRKPEIRYKNAEQIKAASALQSTILKRSFSYLKAGGKLVYATCTLNREENEDVVHDFLNENKAKIIFEKTFFPHIDGTDGFYAAVIEKYE